MGLPVKAGVTIYQGALVAVGADGYAVPAKKAESIWEEDKPYEYKYYYPIKYRQMSGSTSTKPSENLLHENWRSVEVMLNLAEAYTRKNNEVTSDALDLLNDLRRCRLDSEAYVEKRQQIFRMPKLC